MEKFKKKIGYSEKYLSIDKALKNKVEGDCAVCCEFGPLIQNICGDSFC